MSKQAKIREEVDSWPKEKLLKYHKSGDVGTYMYDYVEKRLENIENAPKRVEELKNAEKDLKELEKPKRSLWKKIKRIFKK